MSISLARRGGNRPGVADDRQEAPNAHRSNREDFLRRHQRECNAAIAEDQDRREVAAKLIDRVADPRTIRCAMDHLISYGGTAPGPNGLRLNDLDAQEAWDLARVLGKAIRSGRYRPGPERTVRIPKVGRAGYRTLTLQNAEDRVVQRAILNAVEPMIDPLFLPTTCGFRPGRGILHALALAEASMKQEGNRVVIAEDIKDAFDNIPIGRLMDIVRKFVPDEKMVNLIEAVARKPGSKRGIRQGGALSPLLLNVYLHHFLDMPWKQRHPNTTLIRVADDLLILCKEKGEAQATYSELDALLRPTGMRLKGTPESTIKNLEAGETVEWLGYGLRWHDGEMKAHVLQKSWTQLGRRLEDALQKAEPVSRVRDTILGWADALGPCAPGLKQDTVYQRIRRIAGECGCRRVPDAQCLWQRIQRAHQRWRDLCAESAHARQLCRGSSAVPPLRFHAVSGMDSGASGCSAPFFSSSGDSPDEVPF